MFQVYFLRLIQVDLLLVDVARLTMYFHFDIGLFLWNKILELTFGHFWNPNWAVIIENGLVCFDVLERFSSSGSGWPRIHFQWIKRVYHNLWSKKYFLIKLMWNIYLWRFIWVFRFELDVNRFLQRLHSHGFSPVWTSSCFCKCASWVKDFVHFVHLNGRSPVCTRLWTWSFLLNMAQNTLGTCPEYSLNKERSNCKYLPLNCWVVQISCDRYRNHKSVFRFLSLVHMEVHDGHF